MDDSAKVEVERKELPPEVTPLSKKCPHKLESVWPDFPIMVGPQWDVYPRLSFDDTQYFFEDEECLYDSDDLEDLEEECAEEQGAEVEKEEIGKQDEPMKEDGDGSKTEPEEAEDEEAKKEREYRERRLEIAEGKRKVSFIVVDNDQYLGPPCKRGKVNYVGLENGMGSFNFMDK